MAKTNQNLSKAEIYERVIVSDDEQPYSIPSNWVWTRVENCCDVTSSKRVYKEDWKQKGIPFFRTRELVILSENGSINNELFISNEMYEKFRNEYGVPLAGDLLISGVGTIGVPYVVPSDKEFYFKDGNIIWLKNKGINARYLFFLYKSDFLINQIHEYSSGTTVDTYTIITAKKTVIPLPPLGEQQRIVERIESLFEKLDHAKELVQNALDSFGNRKAAIFHQAFSGEMTKKWRESKNESMESWIIAKFGEIATIESNLVDPKKYLDFPHIAPDNIEKGTGKLLKYNTIREDCVFSSKHRFYPGQILYSKIRPYLSKVVIVDFDGLCSADMYPIETKEQTKYLWYFMLSDDFLEQASSAGSRSVLPKINQKELSTLNITLPTIPEQEEIVRGLDDIFSKEEKAKELYDVIDRIDSMKKIILSRAFRGELGTNDPHESSKLLINELIENSRSSTYSQEAKHIKSLKIDPKIEKQLKTNIEKKIYMLLLEKGKAEISDILTVRKNHLDVSQSLSRLEKIDLIEKKNGFYSCK